MLDVAYDEMVSFKRLPLAILFASQRSAFALEYNLLLTGPAGMSSILGSE